MMMITDVANPYETAVSLGIRLTCEYLREEALLVAPYYLYGARPRAGHYTDSRYARDQLEVIFLYSSAYALLV